VARGVIEGDAEHTVVIGLPAGKQIWVAAGATDMRKGFDTLCLVRVAR
jgi:hypothetical protein